LLWGRRRPSGRSVGDVEREFVLWLVIVLATGIILVLLPHLGGPVTEWSWAQTFVRDVGVALIVAFILTLMIEWHARNRLQSEVSEGVIDATLQTIIPKSIYEEVKNHIFRKEVIRENWTLTMNFTRPADWPQGYLKISTSISYRLRNLTNYTYRFRVYSKLSPHRAFTEPSGSKVPRIEGASIGERTYDAAKLLGEGFLSDDRRELNVPYPLDSIPRETATHSLPQATISIVEACTDTDSFCWHTFDMVENASIIVTHPVDVEIEVIARHPAPERLVRSPIKLEDNEVYNFAGGILPCQSFEFILRPRS